MFNEYFNPTTIVLFGFTCLTVAYIIFGYKLLTRKPKESN